MTAAAAEKRNCTGCALPWQWVDDIPRESWDIPLGACVDGEEIRYFSGGKNPSKS